MRHWDTVVHGLAYLWTMHIGSGYSVLSLASTPSQTCEHTYITLASRWWIYLGWFFNQSRSKRQNCWHGTWKEKKNAIKKYSGSRSWTGKLNQCQEVLWWATSDSMISYCLNIKLYLAAEFIRLLESWRLILSSCSLVRAASMVGNMVILLPQMNNLYTT